MPTPLLGAPTWTEGQALPATRGNEIVRWLEYFCAGGSIIDRDLADPSALTPAEGEGYIVATGGTDDWLGEDDKIALFINTAWVFITPMEGMRLWIADEGLETRYSGTFGVDGVWNDLTSVIPSGTRGQVLRHNGSAFAAADALPYRTVAGTSDTPVLADLDGLIEFTSNSAVAITIPDDTAVAYPLRTRLNFLQSGTGQLTISGDTGVTVNYADLFVNKSYGQYSIVTAIKTAADEWLLTGTLELAP